VDGEGIAAAAAADAEKKNRDENCFGAWQIFFLI
jgi:hypothetical protein